MDDLLQQGITAFKAGKRDEARKIFITIVKQSPDNERAWGGMYEVSNDDKERAYCLKQMLRINPKNEKANQLLNQLLAPPQTSYTPLSSIPTPTVDNKSAPKIIQKIQSPINKKASKNIWIIGAALGIIGFIGIICVLAIGILLNNQQLATISTPKLPIAPTITSTPQPPTGKWQVSTKISEFDNSTTVGIFLDAENYIQAWLNATLPRLILRCKESKTEVYVHIGTQSDVEYGVYEAATVRVRFDQNQAFEMIADESTDGEALFFRNSAEMITSMLQSNEMVFGFTPFNAAPVITKFDLRGLENVIAPLKQSCNLNSVPPTIPFLPTLKPTAIKPTATALPVDSIFVIENWQIRVDKVLTTPSTSFNGEVEKAAGRFALVFMYVTNLGLSPDTFDAYLTLYIKDANDQRYEVNTGASIDASIQYNAEFGAKINPDATGYVVAAFDISKESAYYFLVPGMFAEQNGISLLLNVPNP